MQACLSVPLCLTQPLPARARALQLVTGKSLVLSGLGIAALAAAAASAAAQGQGLESLWGGWHEPASWAALLWAGLGPGAMASYLHVKVRAKEECSMAGRSLRSVLQGLVRLDRLNAGMGPGVPSARLHLCKRTVAEDNLEALVAVSHPASSTDASSPTH